MEIIVDFKEEFHLRPLTKVVSVASGFKSDIRAKYGQVSASAKSLVEMFDVALEASKNSSTKIVFEIHGEDDSAAAIALSELSPKG